MTLYTHTHTYNMRRSQSFSVAKLELKVLSHQAMRAGMTLVVSEFKESRLVLLNRVRNSDADEHCAIL